MTQSATLRSSSAIAKAEAINDSTEFTGVTAYVTESVRAGTGDVDGGNLDESNYIMINDRIFTGFTVEAGDANEAFINAVNADLGETESLRVVTKMDKSSSQRPMAETLMSRLLVILPPRVCGRKCDNSERSSGLRQSVSLTGTAEAAGGFGDDALVAVTAANSVHSPVLKHVRAPMMPCSSSTERFHRSPETE